MTAPTDFECEGRTVPYLSQANLSIRRLGRQITLLDNKASRLLQIVRQPFDQKLPFNFSIVSRSIDPCHKLNIINVMRSVSRFSRSRKWNRCTQRVARRPRLCRLISAPSRDLSTVALRTSRSTMYFLPWRASKEFMQRAEGRNYWPC